MGWGQSKNKLNLNTIHYVKNGPADLLAKQSKHSVRRGPEEKGKYNSSFLTDSEDAKIKQLLMTLPVEELPNLIDEVGNLVVHNTREIKTDPVMTLALSIANTATSLSAQIKLLQKTATQLGVNQTQVKAAHPQNIKKLCKLVAKRTYSVFNQIRKKFLFTKTAAGLAYGFDKTLLFTFCTKHDTSTLGLLKFTACIGGGMTYLVFSKKLVRDIRKFTRGDDENVISQLHGLALYKEVAETIGKYIVPDMAGFHQLMNIVNNNGINTMMTSLDRGLSFVEMVPTSWDGVVQVGTAVGNWLTLSFEASVNYLSKLIADNVVQGIKTGAKYGARAVKTVANTIRKTNRLVNQKVQEGANLAKDAFTHSLRWLKDQASARYWGNKKITEKYNAEHPVPSNVQRDLIDLDHSYPKTQQQHIGFIGDEHPPLLQIT